MLWASSVVGSCRLLRLLAQVDADPQSGRQALPSLHTSSSPFSSASLHGASSPKLDLAVQGPQLAIGALARIALLCRELAPCLNRSAIFVGRRDRMAVATSLHRQCLALLAHLSTASAAHS